MYKSMRAPVIHDYLATEIETWNNYDRYGVVMLNEDRAVGYIPNRLQNSQNITQYFWLLVEK